MLLRSRFRVLKSGYPHYAADRCQSSKYQACQQAAEAGLWSGSVPVDSSFRSQALAVSLPHCRQAERLVNQAANASTFEALAREWIDKKAPGWTPYYLRQVERFMAADVFPYIGKLPIRNVTAAHLLEIIRRVEERGAETVALLTTAVVIRHLPLCRCHSTGRSRSCRGSERRNSSAQGRTPQAFHQRSDCAVY